MEDGGAFALGEGTEHGPPPLAPKVVLNAGALSV